MLNIYLASSFRYVAEVEYLADYLQAKGHSIACEWWKTDYKTKLKTDSLNEWFSNPIIKVIYKRSIDAIRSANLVILVSPEVTKFNGANIEVGIALALDKPVIAYGVIEKSGMYEPLVRCSNFSELELALKEFEM